MITYEEAKAFVGHNVTVELPRSATGRARYRSGHLDTIGSTGMVVVDRHDRRFIVSFGGVVSIGSSTDGSHWPARPIVNAEFDELFKPLLAIARGWAGGREFPSARGDESNDVDPIGVCNDITQTVIRWIERIPALDDMPDADKLPLENCTGATDQCPHYACPDGGWHPGAAPNCSDTPDCAEEGEDE